MSDVVLDIEGTVGPTTFVRDTLFPYARRRLPAVLHAAPEAARPHVEEAIASVRAHLGDPDADVSAVAAELQRMSDADLKVAALKTLQGIIWEDGYRSGELVAPVFDDVPPALTRWTSAGRRVFVYSSGSELAQRLWFAHTDHGDLGRHITHHFDTVSAGPKKVSGSYARIAARTGRSPETLTFLSDSLDELDAADRAGWRTVAVDRDGGARRCWPRVVGSFDELTF